jgi:hypothetical protein
VELIDYLPDQSGADLQERGGWQYHSNDIAATKVTASYVTGGLVAPFSAATKNLAIDEDGELYSIASNGVVTDVGAAVTVSQNPVFHRDKAIIPAAGGVTAPKYYDGATLAALAGSPPSRRVRVRPQGPDGVGPDDGEQGTPVVLGCG